MSGEIKRINPRRPFHVTAEGLKRIILGETGTGTATGPLAAHRDAAPKPLRLYQEPTAYHLVIAHSGRGTLDAHARQAIAAAALLADADTSVAVLILGELTEDIAPVGADRIFVATGCDKALFNPDLELAVANALIARLNPRHIILPDNAIGDGDLGRRLVARLGLSAAAHVVELRPDAIAAYRQGGAQMARRDLPRLILLDPETTDIALPFRGTGEIMPLAVPAFDSNAYADLGTPPVDATRLGLEEADFIVAAGNGVSDVPTLQALARTFDAAIGASRVAVDDGKFTRDQQVGATGKTVSANVYMAIGISGAVQHLQGIKAVRHRHRHQHRRQCPDRPAGRSHHCRRRAIGDGAIAGSHARPQFPCGGAMSPRILILAALGRNPVTGSARPNRDDLLALELGRQLGHATLLHAGNPDEPALSDYLAYGADTLDVVPAMLGQDIASLLADRAGGHDLILTGTRAEGGEGSGLVPYLVAERLGWPIVAQALEVRIADGHAEVTQGLPKGQRRHIRVRLPAVIVVHPKAPVTPRYAYARRVAGRVVRHEATAVPALDTAWRVEPATRRPVKFKARESKAGHARMLSAIVTEARGGAVVNTGSPADKAQAILSYLRTHKLIDW